mmetsp:Transcript_19121/g.45581  ORF Transcript_19121/g.45581 Transcript_19121/m.45581 type:complete len:236 (-) Transcript_19121:440-1147(-)
MADVVANIWVGKALLGDSPDILKGVRLRLRLRQEVQPVTLQGKHPEEPGARGYPVHAAEGRHEGPPLEQPALLPGLLHLLHLGPEDAVWLGRGRGARRRVCPRYRRRAVLARAVPVKAVEAQGCLFEVVEDVEDHFGGFAAGDARGPAGLRLVLVKGDGELLHERLGERARRVGHKVLLAAVELDKAVPRHPVLRFAIDILREGVGLLELAAPEEGDAAEGSDVYAQGPRWQAPG